MGADSGIILATAQTGMPHRCANNEMKVDHLQGGGFSSKGNFRALLWLSLQSIIRK